MANLIKSDSGLLFYDDFSEKTLMWTLSPSDNFRSLSFGDKGLQIQHNKDYVSYTIVEPSAEEYSCIVKLDHIPLSLEDIAGVLIMSTTKEYAECQSFMATGPSELGNADLVSLDIKNMIQEIMGKNFVQWSENEEELVPDDTDTPESSQEPFVDTIYKYVKFYKMKYKYVFYASSDGYNWIEVGNVKFADSNIIGLFLYGTEDENLLQNSHCYFNYFALYKSKYITINNVDRKQEMEITDKNGKVIMRTDSLEYLHMVSRSSRECTINTTFLPMPIEDATLRIYEKKNYENTIATYPMGDLYGGDSFVLEKDISLFINNQEINPLELYNLGTFYRGSYFIKVDVHNNENDILNDVKIKVIRYSEYYGGEEEVAVALYEEGVSQERLQYSKEIVIDQIEPTQGRSFFMKLIDRPVQDFYMTANSYRFKIIVE